MKWTNIFDSIDELNRILKDISSESVIVYTYGAWDLFHPGHVKFLSRARDLGDFLIVGTVADKPIKKLKGNNRPIQLQEERLITVGSLRCVDAAIAQPNYDPSEILKRLSRVDILTKGDDWDYIPGQETISKLGGQLIKLGYTSGFSTSSTVNKLKHNDNV